jgi:hypothetical protein
MYYSKCQNVDKFSLREVVYVDKWTHIDKLAGVTLWDSLGPLQTMYMTLNTINSVLHHVLDLVWVGGFKSTLH